ncbi:MAG: tRNA (adenosine(37)-N6)-threonylcarbamoyltransferase complex ATPase subunit type 1 TsaE [Dokdonella sp.]
MNATHAALRGIDESRLNELATAVAPHVGTGGVIHLRGELGAGKTTFARALLKAIGVGERIKSPTYSLIETYECGDLRIHHLDLYRIADPGELEWLGLPELTGSGTLLLVEWPERGGHGLPAVDLVIELVHASATRDLSIDALSKRGQEWLAVIAGLKW